MLHEIRCWSVVGWRVLRYAAHRIGLGDPPNMLDIRPEAQVMFSNILRWPKTLRVVGAEHCPQAGPAVFVSNHLFFFDPTFAYRAITLATNEAHKIYFMMRNDFFRQNVILRLIDVDTLVACIGAYGITRGKVRLSELKPFLQLLEAGESFIMYPGRTRSKSGLFMEYRDDIEDPGGASFFLNATQRRKPGVRVPAVPMARTYDPVRGQSAYVFGPPHYLPAKADRHAQHQFDLELMDRMGDLVELNVPQLLAGILYLRCLHNVTKPLTIDSAAVRIRAIADAVPRRLLHPALGDGIEAEVVAAAAYFQRKGQARLTDREIVPNAAAILAAPPLDDAYKKANPAKYLVNQVVHMSDVVAAIEAHARD